MRDLSAIFFGNFGKGRERYCKTAILLSVAVLQATPNIVGLFSSFD